ncbi:hypothetical protein DIPPA_08603 [Diplonema papillatum]|nr:hypothetical protein DIPPA_08603 [Diplonema papillatum]
MVGKRSPGTHKQKNLKMAELLKSKDDCVPDAVDWEKVKLSAFPENLATAARDDDCVFADCRIARCGGVTTPTCIRSFVKTAAAAAKFLPVASAAAWVCPPCLWAVGQGALMVLPRDVGSDTLSEAGTNPKSLVPGLIKPFALSVQRLPS